MLRAERVMRGSWRLGGGKNGHGGEKFSGAQGVALQRLRGVKHVLQHIFMKNLCRKICAERKNALPLHSLSGNSGSPAGEGRAEKAKIC